MAVTLTGSGSPVPSVLSSPQRGKRLRADPGARLPLSAVPRHFGQEGQRGWAGMS